LIGRRHLTKSQIAMLTAKVYPEPAKRGPRKAGEVSSQSEETQGISPTLLSYARKVLNHSKEIAERVVAATMRLRDIAKGG
jgi:hypothetical protein